MKHLLNTLAVASGLALASAALAQPEQWLRYRTSKEGRAYRWLEATTNAPPGVALPKLNGQPWFLRWSTPMDPAGGRWICLDSNRKSGPYNLLFMDTDGSGRLDKEKAIAAERLDQYYAYFPPVRLTFKGEDGPITYHLLFRCYRSRERAPELLISAGGWYEGKVNFADKKLRIQLIDGNVNGTFNDLAPNAYDSDRIEIEGDKTSERFLGRMVEVDEQPFRIDVARDGAFVKVRKAEDVVFGPVRVPETISEFVAYGENGHFVRKPRRGAFTLPAGQYRVQGWKISRKDDKGASWTLSGYSFPDSARFEVAADKPVMLDVGEPVRVPFEASQGTNRQVTFSLRFRGHLGESVELLRGGERPRGPQLSLASLDGAYHYTNSFEFG
jgi:hypothetical protein